MAIEFALTTGMRRGEVCALRWSDLGDDGTITVRRALGSADSGYYVKEPKTRRSRAIPLTGRTFATLQGCRGLRRGYVAPLPDASHDEGSVPNVQPGARRRLACGEGRPLHGDGRVLELVRARPGLRHRYPPEGRAARPYGETPQEATKDASLRGRPHHVFNASQVERVEPYDLSAHALANAEVERVADEFIESLRCPMAEGRVDEAYYRPSTDSITLPLRSQFTSMDAFARTLLHGMCHSTAREVGREVEGSEEGYAREELVAELGSAFAAADADLGMGAYANADMGRTFLENHAAYLQGWLTSIRGDPSALAKAAPQASKTADFIADRRERLVASRGDDARTNALEKEFLSSRTRSAAEISETLGAGSAPRPRARGRDL
ncbi:zincin-like metallopeptidase domain-containing protein [Olsenella sp. Marseille-P4559]|uniref:zincin-like metallopeptidase domain-containing protein n=1 Tax=Olsenella sp. Marseille-P4559 TaxID=2364795 RepID=UPI001A93858E|nr:zincin-like metallopeptidase domain-containing protein [Olsenella sp. Marseille-P4559]